MESAFPTLRIVRLSLDVAGPPGTTLRQSDAKGFPKQFVKKIFFLHSSQGRQTCEISSRFFVLNTVGGFRPGVILIYGRSEVSMLRSPNYRTLVNSSDFASSIQIIQLARFVVLGIRPDPFGCICSSNCQLGCYTTHRVSASTRPHLAAVPVQQVHSTFSILLPPFLMVFN